MQPWATPAFLTLSAYTHENTCSYKTDAANQPGVPSAQKKNNSKTHKNTTIKSNPTTSYTGHNALPHPFQAPSDLLLYMFLLFFPLFPPHYPPPVAASDLSRCSVSKSASPQRSRRASSRSRSARPPVQRGRRRPLELRPSPRDRGRWEECCGMEEVKFRKSCESFFEDLYSYTI